MRVGDEGELQAIIPVRLVRVENVIVSQGQDQVIFVIHYHLQRCIHPADREVTITGMLILTDVSIKGMSRLCSEYSASQQFFCGFLLGCRGFSIGLWVSPI
ncbi:MAG: hypothetical protein R6V43_08105 [Halopseudomonas sp.]